MFTGIERRKVFDNVDFEASIGFFDILATQSPEARYRLAEAGKLYKAQEDIVIESGGSVATLCRGSSFRVAFRMLFSYNRQNRLMVYDDVQKNLWRSGKIFFPLSQRYFFRIFIGIHKKVTKKFNFLLA